MEPEEDVASLQQPNPSLPQELITAILVRLPVKYLLQFKCVSKDWFNLISSPDFVKTHLSFSAKNHTRHRLMLRLLETYNPFLTNNNRPSAIPDAHHVKHCSVSSLFNESVTEAFDLEAPSKSVRIVGSVNGLICLRIAYEALVLWNPSTRKFKQLPGVMPPSGDYWCRYGFGYDEVHDDFKVVALLGKSNDRFVNARIYSLKKDSSRILDDFKGDGMHLDSAKFLNGKLYWITTGVDGWGIASLDLVDEKWRQVEQPCYEEGNYYLKIGVLGSNISVLCNYMTDCWVSRVDIWVMKEYGVKESWTKLTTINYPFDIYGPSPPLFVSNKGEIMLVFGSTLVIYNPEDDSLRCPRVTNIDGRLEAELCIESLVYPILQNEAVTQH